MTSVAVSPTGRIFVTFPRWERNVAVSVAELVGLDPTLAPSPNAAWNACRDAAPSAASPATSFVCVQGVTVDAQGRFRVLDAAALDLTSIIPDRPKLVCIDLATNAVAQVCASGTDVAPQGSYLDDVRVTPDGTRRDHELRPAGLAGDGRLTTGAVRAVLVGDGSAHHDPNIVITRTALRQPNGEAARFSADTLAIDAAGQNACWKARTGMELLSLPIATLSDTSLTPTQLAAVVKAYLQSRGSFAIVAQDTRLL